VEDHIVSTAGDALSGDAARHSCTLKAILFQLKGSNFKYLVVPRAQETLDEQLILTDEK